MEGGLLGYQITEYRGGVLAAPPCAESRRQDEANPPESEADSPGQYLTIL
jgi:hypothetical protein